MRSAERRSLVAVALAAALGCGGGGGGGGGALPATGLNVVPVSVDGAGCGTNPGTYVNEPCVSVTVCSPGAQTCQTIGDVLLDTGSFGLRIFKQVLTVPLGTVAAGGGELAECVQYGDLSSDWGPVRTAGVVLGGEPAVQVPIQVIDATYAGKPASCTNVETDPSTAGFNGILGVGAFVQDCGAACAGSSSPAMYFACVGGTCAATAVPLAQQVTNPVAALPGDGNGVVVVLPSVGASGAPSAGGTLLLGIGTAQDNAPGAVSVLDLDAYGEFRTSVAGASYSSFADTGSNALFFNAPSGLSLPPCASDPHWYCPSPAASLVATNTGASGHGSAAAAFQVANFSQLPTATMAVFSNLAGPAGASPAFDWGLPCFFGRAVYVGFEGRGSPLGTGPYVAY